jgi:hypothetical protein
MYLDGDYVSMTADFGVSRKSFLTSLLCIVLISSLFICISVNDTNGAPLENAIHVKNETELKNAINNTPDNKPTTITIDNDITLNNYDEDNHTYNYHVATLVIPANKDITLTSNKANGYYKLIGAVNTVDTIIIGDGGVLRIDGIIITHKNGATGSGVHVRSGTLYLYSGEILGNTVNEPFSGGGVVNGGAFIMSGGKIAGNSAWNSGGGVANSGVFEMSGGEISGNTADGGGGVDNGHYSRFTMSGGESSGNTANYNGGGVHMHSYSEFTMSGGEISGNTAVKQGGGIFDSGANSFVLSGGKVSGNTAEEYNNVYPANIGNGSSGGNGGANNGDGFSLRGIVVACGITAIVTISIVLVILRISSKKKNRANREKIK